MSNVLPDTPYLSELDPLIARALKARAESINQWGRKEHFGDGTHGDVTALSIAVAHALSFSEYGVFTIDSVNASHILNHDSENGPNKVIWSLRTSANITVTGIFLGPDGHTGKLLFLVNDSAFDITLDHENTAVNPSGSRIKCPNSADHVMGPGDAVVMFQNANENRYQVISGASSGRGRLIGTVYVQSAGSSTYTPSTGTRVIEVELLGAGGGGAGVASAAASQVNLGAGGAAGAWLLKRVTSHFSGATVVVGAGGSGGAAGNNNGADGGDTTFTLTNATVLTAEGGLGGAFRGSFLPPITVGGPIHNTATNGDLNIPGSSSFFGIAPNAFVGFGGGGAGTKYGPYSLGAAVINGSGEDGPDAVGFGAGGSGATSSNSGGNHAGGDGSVGLVIIREYT